jgi:hypothetical protein
VDEGILPLIVRTTLSEMSLFRTNYFEVKKSPPVRLTAQVTQKYRDT